MKIETGYWHGNDAAILNNDNGDLTILVGSYTDEEIAEAAAYMAADEPSDYDDNIIFVSYDEWEKQQ